METPIESPKVIVGDTLYNVRFDLESVFKLEKLGIDNSQILGLITNAKINPVTNITTLASACLYTVGGDEQISLAPAQIAKALGKTPGGQIEAFKELSKAVFEAYTKANLGGAPAATASEPKPDKEPTPEVVQ
jgi:hypothetical protein